MTTMEWRSVQLRSVDLATRQIELVVAPYGEPGQVAPGLVETYARGVFGAEVGANLVPLKLETGPNHAGPVVGRAVSFQDGPDALVGTFQISETPAGDEALVLAADGAVGGSAGFLPHEVSPQDDGSVQLRSADLREVTLTGVPAYRGAAVLAVRSTNDEGNNMDQDTQATDQDAATTDDTQDAVADAVARALDDYRRGVADDDTPTPDIQTRGRGHQYATLGHLVRDVGLHARGADSGATERLTAYMEQGIVDPSGGAVYLNTRAFETPGTTVAGAQGIVPDAYIPDLLELLREGRPIADQFGGRGLPAEGENVVLPKVTQGATVDYQATQGATVSSQNVLTDSDTFPKSTLAGGQGVSIQAQRWSNPSYLDEVVRDHIAAYGEKVDLEAIVGDGATPNATAYTGILAGAGDVAAGGTTTILGVGKIGAAWAAVYAATRRAPSAILMAPVTWGVLLDEVDTEGRPLITQDFPANPLGIGDASRIAGVLRGLPVIVDSNIPVNLGVGTNETPIIVCNFRDALLYEDQGAPAQIALTYPDVLVTDVSVFGFSSLAIRRPTAFQAISGVVAGT